MSRKPRRNMYHSHVEPNLEYIKEIRSSGATIAEICVELGVNMTSWFNYVNKYPALYEAAGVDRSEKITYEPLTKEQVETITFSLTMYIQEDPTEIDEAEEYYMVIRKYDTLYNRV